MRKPKQKGPVALGGANAAGFGTDPHDIPDFDTLLAKMLDLMRAAWRAGLDPADAPDIAVQARKHFAMMVYHVGYERAKAAILAAGPEAGGDR